MACNDQTRQLFHAIKATNIEQVAAALDAGADLEAEAGDRGFRGNKPLGCAALLGHVEIAALLLDRGAQVDSVDRIGQAALHHASAKGHMEVAELLVSRGASLEVADKDGVTPLLQALWHGKHDVATWLLDRGALVDAVTSSGCTVLHLAVGSGHPDLARLLQDANVAAMVDVKQGAGWTALHDAAMKGRLGHVRLLLDAGATLNVTDDEQRTPLHLACRHGHVEVVRELLQRGARVDDAEKDGCSPLMRCSNGRAARLILEFGADRSLRNNRGKTARDVAVARGEDELVEVLDTYFPLKLQMTLFLLGLHGPTPSPLTRFAQHSAFEPKVLSIVAAFHSGKDSPAFEQLHHEAWCC